jgi:hypothetical protein
LEQAAQLESTDLSEESGQQQELTNDEIVKWVYRNRSSSRRS